MQIHINHPPHFNQHPIEVIDMMLAIYGHEAGGGSRESRMVRRLQSEIDMIEGIIGAVGDSPRK